MIFMDTLLLIHGQILCMKGHFESFNQFEFSSSFPLFTMAEKRFIITIPIPKEHQDVPKNPPIQASSKVTLEGTIARQQMERSKQMDHNRQQDVLRPGNSPQQMEDTLQTPQSSQQIDERMQINQSLSHRPDPILS